MRVPLFHSRSLIEEFLPEIAERQREVLTSGRYVLGPELEAFEREFSAYLEVDHCVGVGNGTDALTIALKALGIGDGDEVVVPAVTFYATAEAVVNAGAIPVFADVEEGTWCITPETVEPVLGARTAAILPVHLFGNPAPIARLRELADSFATGGQTIRIVEDAAQAAGASLAGRKAGSLADAATFSFYPSKNLGAFGDGGAVVSNDLEVAEACRRLRNHGSLDKEIHTEIGFNSRLDEAQAVVLRTLLPQLDRWTALRRDAAAAYAELGLGEVTGLPAETDGAEACYHLFIVTTEARERLLEGLASDGIGARVYYTPPLHRQPAMAPFAGESPLPGAERFAESGLALPMGPALQRDQVAEVVESVRRVHDGRKSAAGLLAG